MPSVFVTECTQHLVSRFATFHPNLSPSLLGMTPENSPIRPTLLRNRHTATGFCLRFWVVFRWYSPVAPPFPPILSWCAEGFGLCQLAAHPGHLRLHVSTSSILAAFNPPPGWNIAEPWLHDCHSCFRCSSELSRQCTSSLPWQCFSVLLGAPPRSSSEIRRGSPSKRVD